MAKPLQGKIAVVTGASRGAGRGIALVLGEAGATVYVTGRSIRGGPTPDSVPGTVEDTADEVGRRGGVGIAVRCDHASDPDVAALFARVKEERGRLDILVNNAWAGNEGYDGRTYEDGSRWGTPFWERSEILWTRMIDGGARLHLKATRYAAPLLVAQESGLVVCTSFADRGKYVGDLYYDLAKATISRLAFGMAHELGPRGVACLALSPGWMRTERVLAGGVESLDQTESVEYIGRAVVALARAPEVALARAGETLIVGELAREFGFTDVDGRQPPPFRVAD
jgi:NAD(P)-dependent dehydrogenase (short-subunit alcohol dehydrogenase family)